MIFSISEHLAFNFKPRNITIDQLKEAIKLEYNISPCQFKDFHKTKENWTEAGECLLFDFDNMADITKVKDMLKSYKYLIHTTKSHGKLKNGIYGDRFRLYLFCKKITLNREDYESLLLSLCQLFGSDIQAAICSLAFKGFKNCLFYENDGKLFNWENYFNANKLEIVQEKRQAQQQTKEFKNDKQSFLDQSKWKKMFMPENIGSGNRNASFARILMWARDRGCDRYEAEAIMNWLNSNISDPLPNKEIHQLIKAKYK